MGRGTKTLAVSLALGLGMTACSRDYVVGYLYATNAGSALITAYSIDFQSGSISQLADSPIPDDAQGSNSSPVTLVPSPNGKNLYVINNFVSTVVDYDIGTDGKLYGHQGGTYGVVQGNNLTGSLPTAAAIDPAGKFLYITFQFQNGFTRVRPGPGGLATFPINADGTLGTALTSTVGGVTLPYLPLGNNPVGVAIPATGGFVYVIDDENPGVNSIGVRGTNIANNPGNGAASGVILSFAQNQTTGVLTPILGGILGGVAAGTTPSSIAADPSGHFLYVTDQATNQLYGYTFTNTGAPLAMLNSPFPTGLFPSAVTVDPRGLFVYVANFASSTVNTYAINTATGALSGSGGAQNVSTGPTCIAIEPALGIYLYTSNRTDNSISAEQLNPHSGQLASVQGTQFSSQQLPSCVAAVANGAHATQIVR